MRKRAMAHFGTPTHDLDEGYVYGNQETQRTETRYKCTGGYALEREVRRLRSASSRTQSGIHPRRQHGGISGANTSGPALAPTTLGPPWAVQHPKTVR